MRVGGWQDQVGIILSQLLTMPHWMGCSLLFWPSIKFLTKYSFEQIIENSLKTCAHAGISKVFQDEFWSCKNQSKVVSISRIGLATPMFACSCLVPFPSSWLCCYVLFWYCKRQSCYNQLVFHNSRERDRESFNDGDVTQA